MRTRTHASRGRVCLALLSIVSIAILALAGQASAGIDESSPLPAISSDKPDYTPGELVTLNGSFWAAGEAVHVVVNDDAGQTWRYENDVTAGSDGSFSLQFNLPEHFVAQYSVTATGASSGTATSSFTDANVVVRARASGGPLPVSFPANFARRFDNLTCAATPTAPGTLDGNAFTTSGNNNNYTNSGADADGTQSLRVTAPSPVTISGTTYTFSAWTAEANAVLVTGTTDCFKAAGNGAWNLTANYVADAAAPTDAAVSINGGAAWTSSSTGSVTLDLSASDNVGVSRYRLAETQAGLATASDVTVSPAEASFSRSGVAFTLTGAEASAKAVWLRVCDAANNCSDASDTIGWDKTAPVIVQHDFSPAANAAGWHNTNITVRFKATDSGSGLNAACLTAFPDVSGDRLQSKVISTEGDPVSTSSDSCTDVAGNPAAAVESDDFKLDKTDPSVVVSLARDPDHNGWYNAPVGYSVAGSDDTSGLADCDADGVYSGPDGEDVSVSLTCRDNAGNVGSGSASFDFDDTNPSVTVSLARGPDHNGWYNAPVGYSVAGSDDTSGLASCDADGVYSGPDGEDVSVSRNCTDNAGNVGSGSASFDFDDTNPSVAVNLARDPDRNGWYNAPVGYSAVGSDETSGIDSCDPGAVYSGPDGEPVSVSLSCTDEAGNEGEGSRNLNYDATAPSIAATLSPPANANGWNKTDVTVSFTCTDNLSGIDPSYGCPADQTLTSQGLHTLHVATSDMAGNVVTPSFDVRIDKTNPAISGSASPAPNGNGWNNTNVVVSFSCFDGLSGIDFCEPDHTLSSNGAGQSVSGDAKDKAGNQASATVSDINIDKAPPNVSVTGVANGATYSQGSVPAAGCNTTDQAELSGVDTPATVSVSGPASGVGSFTATCSGATDRAGNSAAAVFVTYNVVYNWTGFFQPIDNNPDQSGNPAFATVWNSAKAGQAIPVKFSLLGNQGLSIFQAGYPKSTKVTCPNASVPVDGIETYAASTPGLHYDETVDQYVYVWKTASSLANTCQRLEVKLVDGTSHYAFFKFVK